MSTPMTVTTRPRAGRTTPDDEDAGRPATASFEDFVRATGAPLHRTALLLTAGDHHAADDLLQSTYATVFASWRRVRRSDHPAAYVRTILTRTWISSRRLRSAGERPTDDLGLDAPGPDQDHDARLDLLRALGSLAPDDRAVLVLRFYEDLSVAQAADLLRISPAAVRKRSERALARLRALLPDLVDPTAPTPEDLP